MMLKKIKIKNIRSYEDSEIIFPKGSVLLSGDIGSGKTTILLAIEFALFGLQPGQKGSSLLRNNQDEGFVELEFESGSDKIAITRCLKRKKTISQDSAFITINGNKTEKSITEIKNQVLNILKYPLEFSKKINLLYRFTVYTPQEQMKQIILENPETRLDTIRHIFGIDKYKRIKENTQILAAKLRELIRLKQGQVYDLDDLEQKLKQKKQFLLEFSKQISILENEIKEIKAKRENEQSIINKIQDKINQKKTLENEIEKTNILITTKKEQLLKNNKEIKEFRNKIETLSKNFDKNQLDAISNSLFGKKQIREELKNKIADMNSKLNSINSKRQELDELKNKITNLQSCPTCLQDVGENHKQGIFRQVQEEKYLLETAGEKIKIEKQKSEFNLNDINKDIDLLEKQKLELERTKVRFESVKEDIKKIYDLEHQNNFLNKDITLLDEQISRIRQGVSELKKYETNYLLKQQELESILSQEKALEIKKAETVKELEIGKKDILDLRSQINKKQQIKQELLYNSEIENWLSNHFTEMVSQIEKNVMIKLRYEFSTLFSEWFSILVPEEFIVRLDDSFTPLIENQGAEIDYNYLSGGERTAVALAYRLALNQTINSAMSNIKTKGLVILDEPTDGFSQKQLDKMRDVLHQLNAEQLILVSHDHKIESFVDNIIRLNKEQGVSRIG